MSSSQQLSYLTNLLESLKKITDECETCTSTHMKILLWKFSKISNTFVHQENIPVLVSCCMKYVDLLLRSAESLQPVRAKHKQHLHYYFSNLSDVGKRAELKNRFLEEIAVPMLERITDPSVNSLCGQELASTLNEIAANSNTIVRKKIVKSRARMYMYKLPDLIESHCDYEYQTYLVEILFRMCSSDFIYKHIDEFFPGAEELQQHLLNVKLQDFDRTMRNFLNAVNHIKKNVFSIPASSAYLDKFVINPPISDSGHTMDLWVDFNILSCTIGIFCSRSSFIGKPSSQEDEWELLTFFTSDISCVQLQRESTKSKQLIQFSVLFHKTAPCHHLFSASEEPASAKVLKLVIQNEIVNELEEVLLNMFKEKIEINRCDQQESEKMSNSKNSQYYTAEITDSMISHVIKRRISSDSRSEKSYVNVLLCRNVEDLLPAEKAVSEKVNHTERNGKHISYNLTNQTENSVQYFSCKETYSYESQLNHGWCYSSVDFADTQNLIETRKTTVDDLIKASNDADLVIEQNELIKLGLINEINYSVSKKSMQEKQLIKTASEVAVTSDSSIASALETSSQNVDNEKETNYETANYLNHNEVVSNESASQRQMKIIEVTPIATDYQEYFVFDPSIISLNDETTSDCDIQSMKDDQKQNKIIQTSNEIYPVITLHESDDVEDCFVFDSNEIICRNSNNIDQKEVVIRESMPDGDEKVLQPKKRNHEQNKRTEISKEIYPIIILDESDDDADYFVSEATIISPSAMLFENAENEVEIICRNSNNVDQKEVIIRESMPDCDEKVSQPKKRNQEQRKIPDVSDEICPIIILDESDDDADYFVSEAPVISPSAMPFENAENEVEIISRNSNNIDLKEVVVCDNTPVGDEKVSQPKKRNQEQSKITEISKEIYPIIILDESDDDADYFVSEASVISSSATPFENTENEVEIISRYSNHIDKKEVVICESVPDSNAKVSQTKKRVQEQKKLTEVLGEIYPIKNSSNIDQEEIVIYESALDSDEKFSQSKKHAQEQKKITEIIILDESDDDEDYFPSNSEITSTVAAPFQNIIKENEIICRNNINQEETVIGESTLDNNEQISRPKKRDQEQKKITEIIVLDGSDDEDYYFVSKATFTSPSARPFENAEKEEEIICSNSNNINQNEVEIGESTADPDLKISQPMECDQKLKRISDEIPGTSLPEQTDDSEDSSVNETSIISVLATAFQNEENEEDIISGTTNNIVIDESFPNSDEEVSRPKQTEVTEISHKMALITIPKQLEGRIGEKKNTETGYDTEKNLFEEPKEIELNQESNVPKHNLGFENVLIRLPNVVVEKMDFDKFLRKSLSAQNLSNKEQISTSAEDTSSERISRSIYEVTTEMFENQESENVREILVNLPTNRDREHKRFTEISDEITPVTKPVESGKQKKKTETSHNIQKIFYEEEYSLIGDRHKVCFENEEIRFPIVVLEKMNFEKCLGKNLLPQSFDNKEQCCTDAEETDDKSVSSSIFKVSTEKFESQENLILSGEVLVNLERQHVELGKQKQTKLLIPRIHTEKFDLNFNLQKIVSPITQNKSISNLDLKENEFDSLFSSIENELKVKGKPKKRKLYTEGDLSYLEDVREEGSRITTTALVHEPPRRTHEDKDFEDYEEHFSEHSSLQSSNKKQITDGKRSISIPIFDVPNKTFENQENQDSQEILANLERENKESEKQKLKQVLPENDLDEEQNTRYHTETFKSNHRSQSTISPNIRNTNISAMNIIENESILSIKGNELESNRKSRKRKLLYIEGDLSYLQAMREAASIDKATTLQEVPHSFQHTQRSTSIQKKMNHEDWQSTNIRKDFSCRNERQTDFNEEETDFTHRTTDEQSKLFDKYFPSNYSSAINNVTWQRNSKLAKRKYRCGKIKHHDRQRFTSINSSNEALDDNRTYASIYITRTSCFDDPSRKRQKLSTVREKNLDYLGATQAKQIRLFSESSAKETNQKRRNLNSSKVKNDEIDKQKTNLTVPRVKILQNFLVCSATNSTLLTEEMQVTSIPVAQEQKEVSGITILKSPASKHVCCPNLKIFILVVVRRWILKQHFVVSFELTSILYLFNV